MAFEELLLLLSKRESLEAKQDAAFSLFMLATGETLASEEEELTPGDPEWKAIAARAEACGLEMLARAAASADTSTREAAEYAAKPGGEAVAEAYRRMAASAVARPSSHARSRRDDPLGLGLRFSKAARHVEVQEA